MPEIRMPLQTPVEKLSAPPPLLLYFTLKGDLAPLADDFDALVRENNQFLDNMDRETRARALAENGEGFVYYNVVVTQEVASSTRWLVDAVASGGVDVLRFGETVRKPSVKALFNDSVRVLGVAPSGLVGKLGKVPKLLKSQLTPGGPTSCAVNQLADAAILSGHKLAAPVLTTYDDVAKAIGLTGPQAVSPGRIFKGVPPELRIPALKQLGIPAERLSVKTMQDVVDTALRTDSPLTIGFWWKNPANPMQIAGGHAMTVFRDPLGKVRFLDQFGIWSREVQKDGKVLFKNVWPKAEKRLTSGTEMFREFAESQIHSLDDYPALAKGATILPEWTRGLLLPATGAARAADDSKTPPVDAGPFGLVGLAVPLFEIDPANLALLEAAVRRATGRPRPTAPTKAITARSSGPTGVPSLKNRDGLFPVPGGPATETTLIGNVHHYVVKSGDTLIGLAKKFYGDGSYYPVIRDANNLPPGIQPHQQLPIGTVLKIAG